LMVCFALACISVSIDGSFAYIFSGSLFVMMICMESACLRPFCTND